MSTQGRWLGDWPGDWHGADGSAPTQAAPRSLLAFWVGGAVAGVAPTTSVGVRSLLAPWAGGASAAPAPATDVGVRGLLAPWIGGAAAPATTGSAVGVRSLLGFWAGGYAVGPAVDPPDVFEGPTIGGPDRRLFPSDDELIDIAFALIASGALDG